jgi:adenine-specific DNA-methyltransferase
MALFAIDRDRLAFLLETDATLDLDFEALEALPGTAAGKPSRKSGRNTSPTTSTRSRSWSIGYISQHY